jgi:hypothetical protein
MISAVIAAAAWIVAASYREAPWFSLRRSRNRNVELAAG